ncbi:MAG: histidine kinase, partial [Bacteroidota bacterium]
MIKINHKILFILLLQFSFGNTSFAQRKEIDSLQKLLSLLADTSRVDCMSEIAHQYILLEVHNEDNLQLYRDTALHYAETIYTESKKINYVHGIAMSFSFKASATFIHSGNQKAKESEIFSRESLKWYAATANKKGIEVTYWQLGAALFYQYKADEGYPYLEQAYYWAEVHNNKGWMYNILGFIYENCRDIGDYEKAFNAFQRVQQLNLKYDGKIDSMYEYYVLGELNRRIENYPIALKNYREVVKRMDLNHENIWFRVSFPELFALNGQMDSAKHYYDLIDSVKLNRHDLRFYLVSIGEYYLLQKEYNKALNCLLRGLNFHQEAHDFTQANRALLDISKTYEASGQDNEALTYVRQGLDLSQQTHSVQYNRDAYQILYNIYQRKNKTDSAFFYYKKYVAQKEIVANDVVKGKFITYNYDQKIDQLNKDKQLQQQEIKQATLQRQLLIFGITILFILCIAIFRIIHLKRKNEANRRAIAENELQLQKLESAKSRAELQQQATELEMQALRAQMNPHFIFNCLSSINRFILKNESDIASDYLTKFSRLVRMVLNNSQKEAILLEDELEMLRLYLDLERLRFKNAFDYSISFHNNFDAASIYIPPLLLQPFAENAIWHGLMHKDGNGFIEVAFALENNMLNCFITDNGVGRKNADLLKSKSAEKQKSMGMKITSKRLALLNRNMEQT